MKILKDREQIIELLISKMNRLARISCAEYPSNPENLEAFKKKQEAAEKYINELYDVENIISWKGNYMLVPKPTFEKQLKAADICNLEYDGEFCKVVAISTFPAESICMIYTVALNTI